jgi:hypothetical protein
MSLQMGISTKANSAMVTGKDKAVTPGLTRATIVANG